LIILKIERISENQIKFFLTSDDLSQRDIQLHELAYGSPKAQGLFREVMERAQVECDFHTSTETPLIIEAIPTSTDSIMVIVTKVASTADMEARFGYPPILGQMHNADANKNYAKFKELMQQHGNPQHPFASQPNTPTEDIKVAVFVFDNLDQVVAASLRYVGTYIGQNSLYKYQNKFHLVVDMEKQKLNEHQQSILQEYSYKSSNLAISEAFLQEHGEAIILTNAMEVLAAHLA